MVWCTRAAPAPRRRGHPGPAVLRRLDWYDVRSLLPSCGQARPGNGTIEMGDALLVFNPVAVGGVPPNKISEWASPPTTPSHKLGRDDPQWTIQHSSERKDVPTAGGGFCSTLSTACCQSLGHSPGVCCSFVLIFIIAVNCLKYLWDQLWDLL